MRARYDYAHHGDAGAEFAALVPDDAQAFLDLATSLGKFRQTYPRRRETMAQAFAPYRTSPTRSMWGARPSAAWGAGSALPAT